MSEHEIHLPVMLREVISFLTPPSGGRVVDATVGLGGHAEGFFKAIPDLQILGIDRDAEALEITRRRLAQYADNLHLFEGNYTHLKAAMARVGWHTADGILADLGVSSLQLSRPERGFSFSHDGPLDMRMGKQDVTAATIVNTWESPALADIFFTLGEEPMSRKIARAIEQNRPITTTRELAELIHRLKGPREGRVDSATRVFQALRITVNRELNHLESFIPEAVEVLEPGGRLAVITFHSLEDRIVKHLMRHFAGGCICPPGRPYCTCKPVKAVRILTKKVVRPTREESRENPRSRSAKLRVAEKL